MGRGRGPRRRGFGRWGGGDKGEWGWIRIKDKGIGYENTTVKPTTLYAHLKVIFERNS